MAQKDQWRSVAFRTWAIGGASKNPHSSTNIFHNSLRPTEKQPNSAKNFLQHSNSFPRLSQRKSVGKLKRRSSLLTKIPVMIRQLPYNRYDDLYSSSEYVEYAESTNRKSNNEFYQKNKHNSMSQLNYSGPPASPPMLRHQQVPIVSSQSECSIQFPTGKIGQQRVSNYFARNAKEPSPSKYHKRSRISPIMAKSELLFHQPINDPMVTSITSAMSQQMSLSQQKPRFVIDPFANFCGEDARMRTKSLDNCLSIPEKISRLKRKPRREANCCATNGSKKDQSKMESAKNFLRRIYKAKVKQKQESDGCGSIDAKLKLATTPFFQLRKPDPEELPFLPYNIHYQLDESCNVGAPQVPTQSNALTTSLTQSFIAPHEMPRQGYSPTGLCRCSSTSNVYQRNIANPAEYFSSVEINAPAPSSSHRPVAPLYRFDEFSPSLLSDDSLSPVNNHICSSINLNDSPATVSSFTCNCVVDSPATVSSLGYGSLKSFDSGQNQSVMNPRIKRPNVYETPPQPLYHPLTRHNSELQQSFSNWNELFSFLKKEMIDIHRRDVQILQNLETIETQLNSGSLYDSIYKDYKI